MFSLNLINSFFDHTPGLDCSNTGVFNKISFTPYCAANLRYSDEGNLNCPKPGLIY